MSTKTRGSIRKRGSNYSTILTVNGKKQERVAGPTRAHAERQLTERLREMDLGFVQTEKPVTFDKFVETWWPSHIALSDLKPSTVRSYRSLLDARLIPYFKGYRMDKITPALVVKFFTSMSTSTSLTTGEVLKPKTLRNARILLQQIFDHAVAIRMIGRSPVEKKLIRMPSRSSAEREFLRPDEIPRLISNISDENAKCVVHIAIATGLRQGELFALGWEHVDFERKVIQVRRAFSEGMLTVPKSKNSIRDVQIGAAALRMLREHKLRSGDTKWVFVNTEGNPLDGDNFAERVLKPALKAAKIERPITFHSLRHTFASIHLNSGHNLKWVSRQLGHATVAFTLDTYAHLIPDYHGASVDEFDALISGATTSTEASVAG